MTFKQTLSDELKQLAGFQSDQPRTVALSTDGGIEIFVDFTAVDSMSCSVREIRLDVPSIDSQDFDTLKAWAERLSDRITYLMENIGPLEFDPDGKKVLIRSTPPDKSDDETRFYEVLLQTNPSGSFSLRRFKSSNGQPGRQPVDIQVTHEVLSKLVSDLVDTAPVA